MQFPILPEAITDEASAIEFLTNLHNSGFAYHPEDSAHDVLFDTDYQPTYAEREQLNKLMVDVYNLPGVPFTSFDPCEILLNLDK